MKQILNFITLLSCLTAAAQESRFVPGELLIKIEANSYNQQLIDLSGGKTGIMVLDNLNNELGIIQLRQIGQHAKTRTFLLRFASNFAMAETLERYRSLEILEFISPNFYGNCGAEESLTTEITPTDPRFDRQWSFKNIGVGQAGVGPLSATADADTDMDLAWDIQTGDPEMIIATIDGGARMTHPDFASRIWTNPLETANGVDDDGNGLIDDLNGWDFFFNDNDPSDERGHGTNVNGIIGAIANNNQLYAGANWNSKIMVLKSIDYDLNATYASVADAVYYAVDKGAKIINMSLGFSPASTILEDFVIYAENHGVLITAAMMNFNNSTTYYPAGYSLTHSNVVACGSSSPNDYRTVPFDWSATSGSNFGPHINVVAPGIYIYNMAYYSDSVFTVYWSGTSMATPLVAAIASLVWAEAPQLTPGQLRSLLQDTAQDQVGNPTEDTPGFDIYMGYGRANAHTALQAAQLLVRNNFGSATYQELTIVNPERNGQLQLFSRGKYPGMYQFEIQSMEGKMLDRGTIDLKSGIHYLPFNYPTGNYIATFKGDSYSKIFKVLKQ